MVLSIPPSIMLMLHRTVTIVPSISLSKYNEWMDSCIDCED